MAVTLFASSQPVIFPNSNLVLVGGFWRERQQKLLVICVADDVKPTLLCECSCTISSLSALTCMAMAFVEEYI